VDLKALSADVLETLRAAAEKRKVRMELIGEPVAVDGVYRLLHETVYNLCDNAVKYNREGGSVTVSVSETAAGVTLTVTDTGIGIPYAEQGRVFERFYRIDKSHSKELGGTGLGLSIVKHAAQYLGASVTLDSTPGEGTAITLTFPQRTQQKGDGEHSK
jgi:two-component system phosphate regulon sensor histidine kinase PhoR